MESEQSMDLTALMQLEDGLAIILRHPLNLPRRSKVNCPIVDMLRSGFR
jgi:hypothetical protein